MNILFVLRLSDAPNSNYAITSEAIILGRSLNCDILIDDPSVSRKHAEIRMGQGGVEIRDLGSRFGSYIDDRKIHTGTASRGQRVRFGQVAFDVLDPSDINASEETFLPGAPIGESEDLTPAQQKIYKRLLTGLSE